MPFPEKELPVYEHQVAEIQKLWATRKCDTKDIAERTGLKEHQVCRYLHMARPQQCS